MGSQSLFPTVASGNNGSGAVWSSPANIAATDGSYASVTLSTLSDSALLYGENFYFSIPPSATVLGVVLAVNRYAVNGTMKDLTVRLLKGGAGAGNNYAATGATWPNSPATATYGAANNLWGLSLSPADVNAASFGASLAVAGPSGTDTAYVDSFELTVYYTGTSASGGAILLCQMRRAPARPRSFGRRRFGNIDLPPESV